MGTLHEAIQTDAPPAVAALPAHYWEDALRHSVYLTLVRDKIDQLIAKGVIVSPHSKIEPHVSKEIDEHDLWEKIKKAPFDRLQEDENLSLGDVTVMAKGRLMEVDGGYRFTEDERSREDCSDDKCMEGVKAFWSVKRVRQRDAETSPGRYHYELTFSVNSQSPKKQKRPYENPVRTFTVRENAPDTIVGTPQEHPAYQPARPQVPRPQRAIWYHKNIAPKQYTQGRYYNQGLDRIFSSLFSDDETHAEPPRYKPNPYAPPIYPQFSKTGYVGVPSDHHQQKRIMPYPYKPHHNMYKYRPPLPPPPISHMQQHYIDVDVVKHPYVQQPPDHRYISPSNIVKTTRPAVLPTPPTPSFNSTPEFSSAETTDNNQTATVEELTKSTEASTTHPTTGYPTTVYSPTGYKTYSKPRPPIKGNYFPDHIRPPIYNAPPGVFVTMDKKPFKPMPPLKYNMHHSSKPMKRPIDFRPSPQLIDGQFANPADAELESAFRPILTNTKNSTEADSTEDIEVSQSTVKPQSNKNLRNKQTSKKPPKKHENIKWQQVTTSVPDIITASAEEDTMQWADVLGAFSKTTPMLSQNDKKSESTTPMSPPVTQKEITTTSTEVYREPVTTRTTTTTTTTHAPKKRTRPPHKFVKPEKVKKHKRITTTTTTTKAPEKQTLKKHPDLTPQASSAATNAPNSWKVKNKTTTAATTTQPTTTTVTTTKTTTTTQPPTTKTPPPVETTTKTEPTVQPTQPKSKNRFRFSALMQKGTSVKHDRWSTNNTSPDKKTTLLPTGKLPPRRKGSNFQGYTVPTSNFNAREEDKSQRETHSHAFDTKTRSTTEATTAAETTATPLQSAYDVIPVHFNVEPTSAFTQTQNDEDEDHYDNDDNEDSEENQDIQVIKTDNSYDQDTADHAEFIFDLRSSTPSEKANEIEEESIVTEQTVIATTHAVPKNKTKCKKKKHHHLTPTTTITIDEEELATLTPSPSSTKPSSSTGIDLLDELLGSLSTYEESTEKATATKAYESSNRQELEEEESENHEKYLKLDEDFEEFLGNLDGKHRHGHSDDKDDVEYEEDPEAPADDDDVSPFDNEDVDEQEARDNNDKDYEDYRERSYSLLELMAME